MMELSLHWLRIMRALEGESTHGWVGRVFTSSYSGFGEFNLSSDIRAVIKFICGRRSNVESISRFTATFTEFLIEVNFAFSGVVHPCSVLCD